MPNVHFVVPRARRKIAFRQLRFRVSSPLRSMNLQSCRPTLASETYTRATFPAAANSPFAARQPLSLDLPRKRSRFPRRA